MAFADNLAGLPPAEHVAAVELTAPDGRAERIENQPGSAGSVRVYAYLLTRFGAITPLAAGAGLTLYAEHDEDARRHPGKHPNIDRLRGILEGGAVWTGRVVTRPAA